MNKAWRLAGSLIHRVPATAVKLWKSRVLSLMPGVKSVFHSLRSLLSLSALPKPLTTQSPTTNSTDSPSRGPRPGWWVIEYVDRVMLRASALASLCLEVMSLQYQAKGMGFALLYSLFSGLLSLSAHIGEAHSLWLYSHSLRCHPPCSDYLVERVTPKIMSREIRRA